MFTKVDRRRLIRSGMIAGVAAVPLIGCDETENSRPRSQATPQSSGGDFQNDNHQLREVAAADLPFVVDINTAMYGSGLYDSQGVRLFEQGSRVWDHPVAQAQYACRMLANYVFSGNSDFLNAALANAQRLLDTAEDHDGALFYPYIFDVDRHGDPKDVMRAPWYSGMAQGQVLALQVRLYQLTNDEIWLRVARKSFKSFEATDAEDRPWSPTVDEKGYLWLEEYPQSHGNPADETLNGHIFSLLGVYEYWLLTKDVKAERVVQGAITLVRHYISRYRNPGYISRYCLLHELEIAFYHVVHTAQLLLLYSMTGDPFFAVESNLFVKDFPPYGISGDLNLDAGRFAVYTISLEGERTSTQTLDLSESASLAVKERRRFRKDGTFYYKLGDDVLDFEDYWIEEKYPDVILQGPMEGPPSEFGPMAGTMRRLNPPVPGRVERGRYKGFEDHDQVLLYPEREIEFSSLTDVAIHAAQIIDTIDHLLIEADDKGHWWIPSSAGVQIRYSDADA